jgi:uncharacterized membrane protein YagU involved in acid resistance
MKVKAVFEKKKISPLGALVRGAIAGAVGSAVQSWFFRTTASLQPGKTGKEFDPPEFQQKKEMETETVARRLVENFAQRTLTRSQEATGGNLVHYAFGSAWGALYGLVAESVEGKTKMATATKLGSTVWMLSDNVLLPSVKLAAWPNKYKLKTHAYALSAHIVYGMAVISAYEVLKRVAFEKQEAQQAA